MNKTANKPTERTLHEVLIKIQNNKHNTWTVYAMKNGHPLSWFDVVRNGDALITKIVPNLKRKTITLYI